ncbi:type II CRISPR-associated endonuclease Cas1 [Ferruginibacter sp.]|uniref:type II CRISPR-associated endonuclease Cas1 n=1 Tax=Ferruginibacter sp. TaxID=1940288 RepID=UPI001994C563|nr:type II CRISPR-associated endonuclease Cas1 [Ferruginibacter sp.]MBC7628370.1 type II CRISPR-associated endonuclease Cas1 [Ferruginibacter sp.]
MIKRTICIENACFLKFSNEQMVVSYGHIKGMEDKPDKTVPIEDLGILVLEHQQITLTHYLLDKLVSANVAVITCNDTHHPTGLLMPLESNILQSERFRAQIEASEPLKKQLWQQTVKAKISNQAAVIKKWEGKYNLLTSLAASVRSGDEGNNEAVAAAHYWQNLFPPSWNFYRKRDGTAPNNLLNYGYAIVRAGMARAITGAGLLPTHGIFHRNRYNAYCLADDMMEPYRPYVDVVIRTIIHNTSAVATLTQELKVELLKIPTLDVLIDGDKSPLMVAMQRTAVSLARCYAGEQRKLLLPQMP